MKLLLVDDHPVFRNSFERYLKSVVPSNSEIRHAGNGKEALEQLKSFGCDIMLMDINMPVMNGYDTFAAVRKLYPHINILVLSSFDSLEVIAYFLRHGAAGFLTKSADDPDIRAVLRGTIENPVLPPTLIQALTSLPKFNALGDKLELSANERKLINHLQHGMTSKEIATEMSLTQKTVETYRERLLKKTGCKNVAELISFGFSSGLIP